MTTTATDISWRRSPPDGRCGGATGPAAGLLTATWLSVGARRKVRRNCDVCEQPTEPSTG